LQVGCWVCVSSSLSDSPTVAWHPRSPRPHSPTPDAVYSATSNKFEVKLANIEVEAQTMAETRRTTTRRNCCSRLWGQLSRRTAFLATPPPIWIFLIALGLATAFAVCVGQGSLCAWWGEGLCVRGGARLSVGRWACVSFPVCVCVCGGVMLSSALCMARVVRPTCNVNVNVFSFWPVQVCV
jgi:hypothetical protein